MYKMFRVCVTLGFSVWCDLDNDIMQHRRQQSVLGRVLRIYTHVKAQSLPSKMT